MTNFKLQPPRLYIDSSEYFLTFNTYKRKRFLTYKDIPNILLNSMNYLFRDLKIKKKAYIILPDHIHLLLEVKKAKKISAFLRRFKSFSAKEIKNIVGANDYVWQRGTYDHIINDEEDYWSHLDYIHYNPVKHEYVNKPEDWVWSSYKRYLSNNTYEIGWGWEDIEFNVKKGYAFGE